MLYFTAHSIIAYLIWAESALYAAFYHCSLCFFDVIGLSPTRGIVCLDVWLVGTISALDPDCWSLCCPSGLVWGGVWSMMSEMQLLWGPQTTDWAQTSYMLQSLSICERSCCLCYHVAYAFISNFHWPFQQLERNWGVGLGGKTCIWCLFICFFLVCQATLSS